MRKLLLSAFIIVFAISSIAQSQFATFTGPYKDIALKKKEIHPGFVSNYDNTVPGQKLWDFTVIGDTWYDIQALNYGNVMQRMYAYPDGTIGSTWTCRGETGVPERGAAYNYYDGGSWGTHDPHVGAVDRLGTNNYCPWGPDGELIVIYKYVSAAGPLMIYRRPNKGSGTWEELQLDGPAGLSIVWQAAITSGPDNAFLHILAYTYDAVYQGQEHALLYYRSPDGGETWDIEGEIIDGLGEDELVTINALSYDWANPVGNTIAFTYGFDAYGGWVFKSTDNGDTWDRIDVYESPYPSLSAPVSTPVYGSGTGTSACALDSQGNAHVVFPRIRGYFAEDGGRWTYPFTDGLIYWKEGMPVLDSTAVSSYTLDHLIQGGNLLGWVMASGTYEIPQDQPTYANSMVTFPQISIDASDNMFVAYQSIAPDYSSGDYFYRHVIANASWDGGDTWTGQVDLNTDITFIFSECVFPMVSPAIDDVFHVVFQEDQYPGTFEWPNEQAQAVNNNIFHVAIPKSFFVGMEENQLVQSFELSEIYPNPANDRAFFKLTLEESSNVQISVVNTLGQKVISINKGVLPVGKNTLDINIDNLSLGVYNIVVEVDKQIDVRKFIVN